MKRSLLSAVLLCAACLAGAGDTTLTPPEHRRGAEQTYLTFPEWFLVHSPAELADYLRHDTPAAPPSGFPFVRHIGQFWSSYGKVSRSAAEVGDVNFGYHVMVMVIGTSTTVEYALKTAYENSIGRLTELVRQVPVAEDRVAAAVAQDYVDFIRMRPWYEYDFVAALRKVWRAQPASPQESTLRRWERRWVLSSEYGVKALYGWLIKVATRTAYDPALPTTVVVLDADPGAQVTGAPDLQRPSTAGAQSAMLASLPRYEAFMPHAQALANAGFNFVEVAGNRGDILVSLWVPAALDGVSLQQGLQARALFEQPIITQPGWRRCVLALPVARLADGLRAWQAQQVRVEHVYDY